MKEGCQFFVGDKEMRGINLTLIGGRVVMSSSQETRIRVGQVTAARNEAVKSVRTGSRGGEDRGTRWWNLRGADADEGSDARAFRWVTSRRHQETRCTQRTVSVKLNLVFVCTTHSFESDFHAYDILHGGFGTRPDGTTACSKQAVSNGGSEGSVIESSDSCLYWRPCCSVFCYSPFLWK